MKMHGDMQIPKCKTVVGHPIAGKARINLTFRQLNPESDTGQKKLLAADVDTRLS